MARASAATGLLLAVIAFAAVARAQDADIGVRSNPQLCGPVMLQRTTEALSCNANFIWADTPHPLFLLQSQGTEFLQQQLGAATARAEQLAKSVSALELSLEVPSCLVAAFITQHDTYPCCCRLHEIISYMRKCGVTLNHGTQNLHGLPCLTSQHTGCDGDAQRHAAMNTERRVTCRRMRSSSGRQ